MENERLISIAEFCASHSIEVAFVNRLQQHGLIETVVVEQTSFVPIAQLPVLEKITRMHYDLDINLEGIETITHLLQRMDNMQTELKYLQNKLRRYE